SIDRLKVPRSRATTKKRKSDKGEEVTVYPVVHLPEHLPYLANQGVIELHITMARVPDLFRPDRVVIDLDPPSGAFHLVRRAALLTRRAFSQFGLETVPVATGSKGYHVVAAIRPALDSETLGMTLQKMAALLAAEHPDLLTTAFRIANRGERVFVDWL